MPSMASTISVAALCLWLSTQTAIAQSPKDICVIPKQLQREIATKYPEAKLIALSDLEEDDRDFFQKDHGDACPGLVKVDFYGDGEPTFALVLTKKDPAGDRTELVVAHHVGDTWRTAVLGSGGASPYAPVVWSLPAGRYQDIDGNKTLQTTRPVIVFSKYESWAIVYAWTGSRVTKVWIQD